MKYGRAIDEKLGNLGSSPNAITYWLCDLGQVMCGHMKLNSNKFEPCKDDLRISGNVHLFSIRFGVQQGLKK